MVLAPSRISWLSLCCCLINYLWHSPPSCICSSRTGHACCDYVCIDWQAATLKLNQSQTHNCSQVIPKVGETSFPTDAKGTAVGVLRFEWVLCTTSKGLPVKWIVCLRLFQKNTHPKAFSGLEKLESWCYQCSLEKPCEAQCCYLEKPQMSNSSQMSSPFAKLYDKLIQIVHCVQLALRARLGTQVNWQNEGIYWQLHSWHLCMDTFCRKHLHDEAASARPYQQENQQSV